MPSSHRTDRRTRMTKSSIPPIIANQFRFCILRHVAVYRNVDEIRNEAGYLTLDPAYVSVDALRESRKSKDGMESSVM